MEEARSRRDPATAIRHHPFLLVLVVLGSLAVAAGAILAQPPTYHATALLYIDERYNSSQGFDLALQAGELLSAHYVQVATTDPVLSRACKTLAANGEGCQPAALARSVSAATVKGTSMIGISADSRSPGSAARTADAVAAALIDQNKAEVAALTGPTAQHLTDQLNQLNAAIGAEQGAIAQLEGDTSPAGRAGLAQHQATLAELQARRTDFTTQQDQLDLEQLRLEGALTLYQLAPVPSRPAAPDPVLYLGAGLGVGLLLGLLVVLLVERFDDRIFDADELGRAVGAPIAVAVGAGRRADRSFALARAHLLAIRPDLGALLVAAASDARSAGEVAYGLAGAASRAGQRVLLLDDYGGRPPGKPVDAGVRRISPELTLGSINAEGLVTGAGGRDAYDLRLYATPPPSEDPGALMVARQADMAVIVGTGRRTRQRQARRAAEALRFAGVEVAAAILVPDVRSPLRREQERVTEVAPLDAADARLPTWRGPAAS